MAQMVKSLLAMRETWVRSLGQEGPQGEEMATHSGILAWGTPQTEEPGGLQFMGSQRVWCNRNTDTFTFFNLIYSYYRTSLVAQMVKRLPTMRETWVRSLGREDPLENPLQYSCLENPMDERA